MTRNSSSAYHHGDLRRALLDSAGVILEQQGPERLSLREVARAVGVSQSAPFNHFDGKQGLLAALATAGFEVLAESQRLAAIGEPTEERLAALVEDYVRSALATPQRYRLMFGTGITDWSAHPELARAKASSAAPVTDVLTRRVHSLGGEPDVTRLDTAMVTLWSVVHGLTMLLIDGSLDVMKRSGTDQLVRGVASTVLIGVDRATVG